MSTTVFANIRLKGEFDSVYQYVFDFIQQHHWANALGVCRHSPEYKEVVVKGERVRGCQVFEVYRCEDDYLLHTLFQTECPLVTAKMVNNFLTLTGNCPEVAGVVQAFQAHPLWR